MTEQLQKLARPFPTELIKRTEGVFGDFVTHASVTEKLIAICGPFDFSVQEFILDSDGTLTGCLAELSLTIDGRRVTITEVGDADYQAGASNGSRAKNASSDALKRCAMRIGVGLHLWSGDSYRLDRALAVNDRTAESPDRLEKLEEARERSRDAQSPDDRERIAEAQHEAR